MYEMVAHSYNDSFSGHANVEFRIAGNSVGFYGSTIDSATIFGFTGGVFDETNHSLGRIAQNPSNHAATTVVVAESNFWSALSFAQAAAANPNKGNSGYSLLFGNCVDFLNSTFAIGNPISPYTAINNTQAVNLLGNFSFASVYANAVHTLATFDPWSVAWETAISIYDGVREALNNAKGIFGKIKDVVENMFNERVVGTEWDSPIAIDLDGNGVQSISLQDSNVDFDIQGTGSKIHTGWISSGDAFLSFDRSGNGQIDDVSEMFGGKFGEGFSELATFDTNGDSKISSLDTNFGSLSLWQDINLDGVTQQNELSSLVSREVDEISLVQDHSLFDYQNGNILGESSSALVSGVEVDVVDVYFRTAESGANNLAQAMAGFEPLTSAQTELINYSIDAANNQFAVQYA